MLLLRRMCCITANGGASAGQKLFGVLQHHYLYTFNFTHLSERLCHALIFDLPASFTIFPEMLVVVSLVFNDVATMGG